MPRGAVPSVGQLEARIDEAVVIARASEEGVREVGEIAVEAAEQARRAAEAAEQSAVAAQEAAARADRPAGPVSDTAPPQTGGGPVSSPPTGRDGDEQPPVEAGVELAAAEAEEQVERPPRFEERFRRFSERADSVSGRLRRLCEQEAPSVGAGRRRGDG